MTVPRTSSLAWRIGAVAMLCGLPILLLGLIVSNIADTVAANDATTRQKAMLAQIVGKLATHKAQGLTAEDTASLYLGSGTSTLARAEIQARLTKLVEGAGGRLAEVQLTATPEQEAEGTVAILVALDIDNKGLFDLLYGLETGLPLFTVTDFNAHTSGGGADGVGAPTSLHVEMLHVEMTVAGHFRKAAG